VGCATAWELARRGVRVALLDRGAVSGGTTGLGEGNVLCSDKEPGPELALAAAGLALYEELEALFAESAGVRRKGALIVHTDEESWAAEPERLARLRAAGVECSQVTAGEARLLEPELRGEIAGASWFPRDLQCAPRAIARGLAGEAERLGATVATGVEVASIALRGGRVAGLETANGPLGADAVVLAAGAWSCALAGTAGLDLPLEPRKGQLLRLERRPELLRRKVIDGGYMGAVASPAAGLQVSTVIETTLDGHVLIGSSRERRGFDLTVDPAVSDRLLRHAERIVPAVRGLRVDGAWAGLRPWLPGGLPAIGPTAAADGLWIATGHEGAGVAHGPITGRLVAQAICGEAAPLDLGPFDPNRFSRG
jgi:D-hydroxyproline dehydrogenase subunit beta